MIVKWRACINDGKMCGAILTVSSKVFDYVNHFLLIAKLAAYDFSYESLNFIKVI